MSYNLKVNLYDSEIQVTLFKYMIQKGEESNENDRKTSFVPDQQSSKRAKIPFQDNNKVNQVRSCRRSKQTIYDITRSNKWDYFATFTFADKRYDYDLCKQRFRKFLNNFKTRCTPIEYLAVPEQHKDCAWHFHVLIQGNLDGYLSKTWHTGRYELSAYHLGKNEVEPVRDSNRASMYITKYISKDLGLVLKNKRRFFYSKGLNKSVVYEYLVPDNLDLVEFLQANFPDHYISHLNKVEAAGNLIHYIQLKEV